MHFYLIILVFVTANVIICAGQDCQGKGLRKYDENFAKVLTIANSGRKFATSLGEPLKKYCDETANFVKEMEDYKTKCMKNLSKQVTGVFIYSIKNTMRQYCQSSKARVAEFIDATPCLNKHDQIITRCYTTLLNTIMGAKNGPDKEKIPHMCCGIWKLYDCFEEKLPKASGCNEKRTEQLTDMIRNIASNSLDLLCGDYTEDSDKCNSLGPAPKKQKNQPRWKSIAPPILDLLESFPEV